MPTHKRAAKRRRWQRFFTFATVTTLLTLVLALVPILQQMRAERAADRQFDDSGAVYSWFMLDPVNSGVRIEGNTLASTPSYTVVITNRGRTDDSIIGVQQVTDGTTREMHACVADFDEDGVLNEQRPVRPDSASIRIPAGEALLVVLVGETSRVPLDLENGTHLRGEAFAIPDSLLIHTASGRDIKAERDTTVSRSTLDHYEYPQLRNATDICTAYIAQRT